MRPTLFLLHALGSSAAEWSDVQQALGDGYRCVALDLPGFGTRRADDDFAVEQMADNICHAIRADGATAWMIVGHSMGGKLATIVAARAMSGEQGLSGLAGVVLVAASPPSPEPMDEARRARMLQWWETGTIAPQHAVEFIEANTASALGSPALNQAMADVCRSSADAWRAWLQRGSLEDWSAFVGTLEVPALLLAGACDGDLGADAQRRLNLPHLANVRLAVVDGAAHLIPYEQPRVLADHIARHWQTCRQFALPPGFASLVASTRTSRRTRRVLMARRFPLGAHSPGFLDETQRRTLCALVDLVVPRVDHPELLARRVEAAIAQGPGDGWRFADLPADRDTWSLALDGLTGMANGPTITAADLEALDAGELLHPSLPPRQWRLWFADARAQIAQTWMSLPTTMARIGYDGVGTGGDGARPGVDMLALRTTDRVGVAA